MVQNIFQPQINELVTTIYLWINLPYLKQHSTLHLASTNTSKYSIFSRTEQFFLELKLLPVHLTWLHLVYGKIFFQDTHIWWCMWNVFLYNIILGNCQKDCFYFYFYQIMLTIYVTYHLSQYNWLLSLNNVVSISHCNTSDYNICHKGIIAITSLANNICQKHLRIYITWH